MAGSDEGQGEGSLAVSAPDPVEPAANTLRIEVAGKTIWQVIGAILVTLALLWASNQARGLLELVVISFFFSLALEPAVRFLSGRYGWRRGASRVSSTSLVSSS